MENYKDLVLKNQTGAISVIEANPIDVVQRIGKYQFIYDYKVPSFLDSIYTANLLNTGIKKEGISNANENYNFDGDGTGEIKNIKPYVAYTLNPNPQVGSFSKGNIVNVLRFDTNNNAIIENPNYIQPDPNASKSFWAGLVGNLKNQKEFTVPKDYLQKVDDSNSVTIETGINFGSNPKPQPISVIKTIPQVSSDVTLEENATFVLNKDFQYVSGYGSSYCSPDGLCTADMSPKYSILKAGTKVSGRLFKSITNKKVISAISGVSDSMFRPTVIEKEYLAVKGYGDKDSINIPIEYLTRDVAINTNNNNGNVVPVANDNKNLLMIVGAFVLGYLLSEK